jgi:hypothetical protein
VVGRCFFLRPRLTGLIGRILPRVAHALAMRTARRVVTLSDGLLQRPALTFCLRAH